MDTAIHLSAGTVGGISGVLISHPFDTLKVRLQVNQHITLGKAIRDAFRSSSGLRSLYYGITSPIMGTAWIKATAFTGNNVGRDAVRSIAGKPRDAPLTLTQKSLASAFAGAITTVVVTPVERVKIAMQTAIIGTGREPASAIGTVTQLFRQDGIRYGLYRGFLATLARDMPSYAVYFVAYDQCRQRLAQFWGTDPQKLSKVQVATAGAMAGMLSWLPILPLDLIKSHLQSSTSNGDGLRFRDGVMHAYQLSQRHGISVLWRGLNAAMLRAVPCHAAVFVGYETSKRWLEQQRDILHATKARATVTL
eukprot:Clim_evm71s243 gene=Clim_evmTU71s243